MDDERHDQDPKNLPRIADSGSDYGGTSQLPTRLIEDEIDKKSNLGRVENSKVKIRSVKNRILPRLIPTTMLTVVVLKNRILLLILVGLKSQLLCLNLVKKAEEEGRSLLPFQWRIDWF